MPPVKTVTLDGWLVVLLAISPALVAWIAGDEAAKYIAPATIFYLKGIISTAGVGLGALKGYRSMQYAQYKQNGGSDPSTTPVIPATKVQEIKIEAKTNEK